jgi:hypothetical protein
MVENRKRSLKYNRTIGVINQVLPILGFGNLPPLLNSNATRTLPRWLCASLQKNSHLLTVFKPSRKKKIIDGFFKTVRKLINYDGFN